jgi:hypothetical protein
MHWKARPVRMKAGVSLHLATAPRLVTTMDLALPEMQPPAHDTACVPFGDELGIVLSRDLFFTERVTATAEALGYRMLRVGESAQAATVLRRPGPRVVVLDLTAGELVAPEAVSGYRQLTGPGTWFIAVGPHVQADLLEAARSAGCQVVLPRSKFSNELPALLRRYFGQPADRTEPLA